jgi:hypothetical protein
VARVRLTAAAAPMALTAVSTSGTFAPFAPIQIATEVDGGALPYSWSATGLPAGVVSSSSGTRLSLAGTAGAAGRFTPRVELTDARGTKLAFTFDWTVSELVSSVDPIVLALLRPGSGALSATESGFVDQSGNRNGRLDVGDLRAWLARQP